MPTHLKAGDKAPGFSLPSSGGKTIRLDDFRGSKGLVLYFYPKDDTPGCTREACSFRDDISVFRKAGVEVLGVSADDAASHDRFAEKHHLTFPLLADVGGATAKAYGVWNDEKKYSTRATFLIDGSGTIRRVWPEVKVDGHSPEVAAALADLD